MEKKGEGAHFNNFAWPTEQRFWDDLMYNSSQWGLVMYEQARLFAFVRLFFAASAVKKPSGQLGSVNIRCKYTPLSLARAPWHVHLSPAVTGGMINRRQGQQSS